MKNTRSIIFLMAIFLAGQAYADGIWSVPQVLQTITPSGTAPGSTAAWSRTNYAGWLNESWAYNPHMQIGANLYVTPNIDRNFGGVIYKFCSTAPVPMLLNIKAAVKLFGFGGKKATLYFSDKNNWEDLNSPLAGSRWDGMGEWDTNANWTRLNYYSEWTQSDSINNLTGTNIYTDDGTFYIRVDLHQINASLEAVRLTELSVTATVTTPAAASVMVWQPQASTKVSEAGPTSESYMIGLAAAPTATVTITAVPDQQVQINGLGAGNSLLLVYTPSNYGYKTITVTAIDDNVYESWPPATSQSRIRHTVGSTDTRYNVMAVSDVLVDVTDNDRFCGDPGTHFSSADFDHDCYVGISDLSMMLEHWLNCNDPANGTCLITWP